VSRVKEVGRAGTAKFQQKRFCPQISPKGEFLSPKYTKTFRPDFPTAPLFFHGFEIIA